MSKNSFKINIADNLVLSVESGLYGMEDINGTVIVPNMYKYISTPMHGLHLVESYDELFGYINSDGEIIIPTVCNQISHIKHGLIKFLIDDLWGIFDTKGNEILSPQFYSLNIIDKHSVVGTYLGGSEPQTINF